MWVEKNSKLPSFNATMSNTAGKAIDLQVNEDDEPDDWYVVARIS